MLFIQILLIEENPSEIQHIPLGDWQIPIIVAPATANTIAKLSVGIADDLVTSTLLEQTPKFIAPAMNVHMYEINWTQQNINILKRRWGIILSNQEADF